MKIELDISCMETICMMFQILFSREKKQNSLLSAEFAHSMASVKIDLPINCCILQASV